MSCTGSSCLVVKKKQSFSADGSSKLVFLEKGPRDTGDL